MTCHNKDGFSDLNVLSPEKVTDFWDIFEKFHIRNVAFNQIVDFSDLDEKKKKKGEKTEDLLPEPTRVTVPKKYEGKVTVLHRLTLKFSDVSQWYRLMKSPNFKKYHLIAASPQTQQAVQYVCTSNEIDIITFDPENKVPWKMSRKLYKQAVERMIFFELPYVPAIMDSSCRKNTIFLSHSYFTTGKSMNLVVTSGASKAFYLRSPYDVTCLCAVFGLSEKLALRTLWQNPLLLISRAENRRQGKSVVSIIRKLADSSDSMTSDDQGDEALKGPAESSFAKTESVLNKLLFCQNLLYTLYFKNQGVCSEFLKDLENVQIFCGSKTNLSLMSVTTIQQLIARTLSKMEKCSLVQNLRIQKTSLEVYQKRLQIQFGWGKQWYKLMSVTEKFKCLTKIFHVHPKIKSLIYCCRRISRD